MNNKPFLKEPLPRGQRWWFYGIRFKMTLLFGLLVVLLMAITKLVEFYGVPFTDFEGEYAAYEKEAFGKLNLVADLKKERLERWLKERVDDIDVISHSPFVRNSTRDILNIIQKNIAQGTEGRALREALRSKQENGDLVAHLKLIKETYGVYEEIEIIDTQTRLNIASSCNVCLGNFVSKEDIVTTIIKSGDSYMGLGKGHHPGNDSFSLLIARPIHSVDSMGNNEEEVIAIFRATINPEDFLGPLLHTGGGLGVSGEVLLIDHDRKILAPLKHLLADGTKAIPMEYEITAEPARRATRGEEGIIASRDYRGVPVLAAYRHIRVSPQLSWGMVVKRDTAEVFSFLQYSRNYTITVGLLAMVLSLIIISIISGKITYPIRSMSRVAKRIAVGDFSTQVTVESKDEVGFLATSFNTMITRIRNWKVDLEEQVTSRTAELNAVNQQLQASEQQLKASNQQLRASQQQLIASNQQLRASQQQLKASNQQLLASNQQLRAHEQTLHNEIAERKKVEEALAGSEARFRDFFLNASVGFHIFGPDTVIQDINQAELNMIGYTYDEIVGKRKWKELILPEQRDRFEEHWKTINETGAVHNIEYTLVHKKGHHVFVLVHASARFDERRRLINTRGSVADITERKKLEEEREKHLHEMEVFYNASIGRENRIIELKKKIKELEAKSK